MSQCQGSMVNKFQVRQTLVRVVSLSGRSWCIADAALFLFPELRSWCDWNCHGAPQRCVRCNAYDVRDTSLTIYWSCLCYLFRIFLYGLAYSIWLFVCIVSWTFCISFRLLHRNPKIWRKEVLTYSESVHGRAHPIGTGQLVDSILLFKNDFYRKIEIGSFKTSTPFLISKSREEKNREQVRKRPRAGPNKTQMGCAALQAGAGSVVRAGWDKDAAMAVSTIWLESATLSIDHHVYIYAISAFTSWFWVIF